VDAPPELAPPVPLVAAVPPIEVSPPVAGVPPMEGWPPASGAPALLTLPEPWAAPAPPNKIAPPEFGKAAPPTETCEPPTLDLLASDWLRPPQPRNAVTLTSSVWKSLADARTRPTPECRIFAEGVTEANGQSNAQ